MCKASREYCQTSWYRTVWSDYYLPRILKYIKLNSLILFRLDSFDVDQLYYIWSVQTANKKLPDQSFVFSYRQLALPPIASKSTSINWWQLWTSRSLVVSIEQLFNLFHFPLFTHPRFGTTTMIQTIDM